MANLTRLGVEIGRPDSSDDCNRMSDVPAAINHLDTAVSRLEACLTTLGDRLESVLSPRVTGSGSDKGECPKPLRAPLAGKLSDLADRIDAVNGNLDEALRRLEL